MGRGGVAQLLVLITALALAGCGASPAVKNLRRDHTALIIPESFGVCKGYGCRYYVATGLAAAEWREITALFDAPVSTPAAERVRLRAAIALFERFVGPKTGTATDKPGAQLLNFSTRDQMDCIDESFNTATYLFLLRQAGLLRHHRLGAPLRRGYFVDGWPHHTATIHEIDPKTNDGADGESPATGDSGHFVVDSWFHGNGRSPEIVPAHQWSAGWSPATRRK